MNRLSITFGISALGVALTLAVSSIAAQTTGDSTSREVQKIVVTDASNLFDWLRYPWSTLQGKAPPTPPPKPTAPIPDYPKVSFPVLDSGFMAADDENFWWLDNNRVMFKGYEEGTYDPDWEKKTREERQADGRYDTPMKGGFYIWDIRKNTVVLYRRDVYNFCFQDGEAFFQKLDVDPNRLVFMRGPIGTEKEDPEIKPSDFPDNRLITRPCKSNRNYEGSFPLMPGWGVLSAGLKPDTTNPDGSNHEPLAVYTPKAGISVELPMLRKKWGRVIYAPWRDQYLLIDNSENTSKMPEVWWLSKNGQTALITIPHTGYQTAYFFPLKPGVLMAGYGRYGVPRPDEIFLLHSDGSVVSLKRLWPKYDFARKGISPDGCRIAFRGERCENPYKPRLAGMGANSECFTAQMIDFCQKGETK